MSGPKIDMREVVKAKTDQLNADDFKIMPDRAMVAKIVRVANVGGRDQPVSVYLSTWEQPWKPCLTMRRVLVEMWGYDGAEWVGRHVRLIRDPKVSFGDQKEIGGIRISHMSDTPLDVNNLMLTATRGQKRPYRVDRMTPAMLASVGAAPDPLLPLRAAANAAHRRGWTKDQIVAVFGCEKAEQTPEDKRAGMIEALNGDPPSGEREPGQDG